MKSGKLRHRVTFQRAIERDGTNGEIINDWQNIKTVWASVKPITGFEKFDTNQFISGTTHLIEVRYCSELCDMTGKARMLFNGKKYDLTGDPINLFERNRELRIPVKHVSGLEVY